jgi:hypothetical protein
MSELIREKCTACRRDSPQVTETDIAELKPQLPQWTLMERESVKRLERAFRFKNFALHESRRRAGRRRRPSPGYSDRMGSSDGHTVDPQDPGASPQRFYHGGQD